jgi:predicted short-subunit dehydrogenase-like oxidoreductase (DUF2520 family)
VAATHEGVDQTKPHLTSALRRLVSRMRELERELPTDAAPAAGQSSFPRLAVIGPGRAGGSIATAATRAGLTVRLAGRTDALDACRDSEVALLCVPDDQIAVACASAAAAIPPLRFVGHTSGATTLDALSAAREAAAEVFSLHPLQTIPDDRSELVGAPCATAGSTPDALALATELAVRLGMRPFEVPEENRAAYHAAAAMASNLLVALEECAADVLDRAGVDSPSRELLTPLVLRTAANWAERGPDALTGPIARGDVATVERHLEALRAIAPELVPVYESLAERARALGAAEART